MGRFLATAAIIVIITWFIFGGEKEPEQTQQEHDDVTYLKEIFSQVKSVFGSDVAKMAERIAAKETNYFGDPLTFGGASAGMIAYSPQYPYGWDNLVKTWSKIPAYHPTGIRDNGNGVTLIMFPSLQAAIMSIAEWLFQGNDPGAFHRDLSIGEQELYKQSLNNYAITFTA